MGGFRWHGIQKQNVNKSSMEQIASTNDKQEQ